MNILALDTAGQALSAAVSGPGGIFLAESRGKAGHSERLMEMAAFVLESAGLEREDLHAVACMEGPGSFTGLRIGFATAKGLSLALGIPLFTAPTLDCLARPHAHWPGPVIAALDAKQRRFYAGLYRAGTRLAGPLDAAPETIALLVREALAASGGPPEAAAPGLRHRAPSGEAAPARGPLAAPIPLPERNQWAGPGAAPVLITGPDAPLLLEALEPFFPGAVPDPAFGRGRAVELLEIARDNALIFNRNAPLEGGLPAGGGAPDSAGPVYVRKSDAETDAERAEHERGTQYRSNT